MPTSLIPPGFYTMANLSTASEPWCREARSIRRLRSCSEGLPRRSTEYEERGWWTRQRPAHIRTGSAARPRDRRKRYQATRTSTEVLIDPIAKPSDEPKPPNPLFDCSE